MRLRALFLELNGKSRGYVNDYGIHGNSVRLQAFCRRAMGILFKWLNRRSERCSYNGTGFKESRDHFQGPRPRIGIRAKPK